MGFVNDIWPLLEMCAAYEVFEGNRVTRRAVRLYHRQVHDDIRPVQPLRNVGALYVFCPWERHLHPVVVFEYHHLGAGILRGLVYAVFLHVPHGRKGKKGRHVSDINLACPVFVKQFDCRAYDVRVSCGGIAFTGHHVRLHEHGLAFKAELIEPAYEKNRLLHHVVRGFSVAYPYEGASRPMLRMGTPDKTVIGPARVFFSFGGKKGRREG